MGEVSPPTVKTPSYALGHCRGSTPAFLAVNCSKPWEVTTSAGRYCRTSWHPSGVGEMCSSSSITAPSPGTQDLPLQRQCLGLGATSFQPHIPSLPWASHPKQEPPADARLHTILRTPFLPSSHSPASSPSASLQPLSSNNQPSYAVLRNGCKAAPPVFLRHLSHPASPPKPRPVHPQPSFLSIGRGQCKAHSRVKLKLMLLCKGQKHLHANTHRRAGGCEWEGVSQTSTEAETPSLISGGT